jgi:hypothetical protein
LDEAKVATGPEGIGTIEAGSGIFKQVFKVKEVAAKSSLEVGDINWFASDGGGVAVAIGVEVVGGLSGFVLECCQNEAVAASAP